ncbi:MAG: TIGR00374 family protein [Actinobacteria bacterium]|nr:MAG: TIGR00374 family protein [Actinomycetota bacterium]
MSAGAAPIEPSPETLSKREQIRRRRNLVRSPVYIFRVVWGGALAAFGLVNVVLFENALLGLRQDLIDLQASRPLWIVTVTDVAFGVAVVIAIVGTNTWLLVHRRFRRWAVINLAAIVAIVLSSLAGGLVLTLATSDNLRNAMEEGRESLGNAGLASVLAVLTVSGPWITRRLRPWAAVIVTGAVVVSVLQGSSDIVTLPMDVGLGILAGAITALLVKTPSQTPTAQEVAEALGRSGIAVASVRAASVDARASVPWFVTTDEGRKLFVKTQSPENRAADLLFRLYRWMRLRHPGDDWPEPSLRRAVEHEAFVALASWCNGVRTPQLITVAEIGPNAMLLAYERIVAHTLADEDAESDALMRRVWEAVARLQEKGIAHRDLRLANIMVDGKGEIWLIDFGFAELAAHQDLLDRDLAELLASTAARVGNERAVAAAVDVVGPDRVAAAIPWIQPLVLSSATRTQLRDSGSYHRLRDVAAAAVGLEEVPMERVERIRPATLLTIASLALAAYYLLPQLAGVDSLLEAARTAGLWWLGATVVASILTYIGAAVGMVGSVPARLELWPTILAQVASSFANRITPAKVGGMATNVRFLQKQGLRVSAAVSAVGLNTIAGFAVHIALLALAGAAVGNVEATSIPVPSEQAVAWIVGGLILLSGVFMLLPIGRRLVTQNLWPAVRSSAASIGSVAKKPTKLAALFGGSFVVTASYCVAMLASLRAFGDDTPLAVVVTVYLAAAAVATAAPTPGGLGATEAALIAGYVAVGVDGSLAVTAVLLFRLVTFWLPVLPGWLALHSLQRAGWV